MLNNVVLMGRLTADPELRQTSTGIEVTSFSIAIDRGYARQGEERQTDFINCVAWRQTAKFITSYFRKGQMIALVGAIRTRSYEDKKGNKRTAFEVYATEVSFCGSKAGGNPSTASGLPSLAGTAGQSEAEGISYYGNATAADFSEILDDEDFPF